ncbi:aspartyl/asparaginyl beta-hydroxylase domain-containing protein [Actinoplanes sp. L3-i22]|uniref:aspartyl/asparaginyl beta-hydroxylase domain-containing protein n=1 Tax=Actinoplanes sp. L3-i22 TaxID=2836373 RepID=UPI001C791B1F|nr:aspartyl/asparaginyl beta-hydroxylase domain-containing protein [Actinoplanes sp. L3-i22]BCY09356.1 hypothetical protein L3i22_044440 [Actinoplanes sp. L3-i22]
MTGTGACLLAPGFGAAELERDAQTAIHIIGDIRAAVPELAGWINFPLLNQTGTGNDLILEAYPGPARPTEYADRLPAAMSVVRRLTRAGYDFSHARVAVLPGREVLRPHVDMYPAVRLIVALNEQDDDFRHVFDDDVIAMRPGEVWGVDGTQCHGAANVAPSGTRVALLLDARPGSGPGLGAGAWRIPAGRRLRRSAWTAAARERRRARFRGLAGTHGLAAAEKEWHFLAFEFDLRAADAYGELIALYDDLAAGARDPRARRELRGRSEYWTKHSCVCVA